MRRSSVTLLAIAASFGLGAQGCPRVQIHVETTTPGVAEDGLCSLTEAIENSNARDAVHADCEPGEESVVIILQDRETYTLTRAYGDGFGLPRIAGGVTIEGFGSVIERAAGASDFGIINCVNCTLNDLTIRNAAGHEALRASGYLGLDRCVITESDIGVVVKGVTTIVDSSIIGNRTGLWLPCFYDPLPRSSSFAVNRSTIAGNRGGGGVVIEGCGDSQEMSFLTDSTVSGNDAEYGGGVYVIGSEVAISGCTIVENTAFMEGGGIFAEDSAIVELRGSIVARNEGLNCGTAGGGRIDSGGFNLGDDDWCEMDAANDLRVVDPMLSELGDWGGPTMTHLPREGSPAIDVGCFTSRLDQRGFIRPWDGDGDGQKAYDIGSVEVGSHPPLGTPWWWVHQWRNDFLDTFWSR